MPRTNPRNFTFSRRKSIISSVSASSFTFNSSFSSLSCATTAACDMGGDDTDELNVPRSVLYTAVSSLFEFEALVPSSSSSLSSSTWLN